MKKLLAFVLLSVLCATAGNLALDLRDGAVPASLTPDTNSYVSPDDQISFITASKAGDTITFATPEGTFSGTVNLVDKDINGVDVRAGRIANDGGSFVITIVDNELYGHIENVDTGRDIKWEYKDGLQSINNLSFAEADADFINGKELPSPEGTQGASIEGDSINYYDYNDDEIVNIRIAVFYTPASLAYAGSHNRMNSFIAEGVAKGNQCLMNSKINARIQLVHSQQWNYEDAGSSYTDLSNFTNARNGWEGVHEVRNAVGADLCTIVAYLHDVGGLAYVNGSTLGMPESSYNLIRVLQMTGSSWIHEMGHNIGCNHAAEQESSPGPESGGVFGHSLGYYFTGATDHGHYGTVMAYDQGDYHRCDYFSATNVTFKGTMVGYETRNNSLTWNKIRKVARTYRILPTYTFGEWAYDGFGYPPGERLDLKTGGTGWNNGWTPDTVNAYVTCAESLEYSDGVNKLATTPGCLKFNGDTIDYSRMPDQSKAEGICYEHYGETSIWVSLLLKPFADTHGRVYLQFLGNNAGITHDDLYAVNSYDPDREVHPTTDKTDLMLLRYDLRDNGTFKVTIWVDPKLGQTPDDADAVTQSELGIYWTGYKDIYFYAYSAKFYVDELRIGFSAESVLPVKAPNLTATQDESAEAVTVSWTPDTAQQKVTIYRAGTRNFSEAAQVAEVTDASSWTDTDVEAGKLYYYWAEGEYSDSEAKRINGPALGYAGRPTITANANGPYVIQKGEDVTFSAEGSIGENLTYCWSCYKDISDYSPFYKDFLRTNNFSPGTYEVKLTIKDLGLTNAEPQTVTTQLIVKNADPIINFEKSEYNVACGVPSVFHVIVQDPMPQDKFVYTFRTDDEAEFSEWQTSPYFMTAYEEPNSTHTMTCIVADNYGGTNTCTTTVKVGERAAIMSAYPTELNFDETDVLYFRVTNSGAEPYRLTLRPPSGVSVYPASTIVSNGSAVVAVKIDRDSLNFPFSGKLSLGFTNVALKASSALPTLRVEPNGPYTVRRGESAFLTAYGSTVTGHGLRYAWTVDGEYPDYINWDKYLEYYSPEYDISTGEHTLTLYLCDGDENILTNASTTITVVEAQPEMLLSVQSIENNEVTARVFLEGSGGVKARTPKITEGWFEEGVINMRFGFDDCYREIFDIKDRFGATNRYQFTFDLRKEVPRLIPTISCNAEPTRGETYMLGFGQTLELTGEVGTNYTGSVRYFWREWSGNPTRDALEDPNSSKTKTVKTLLPGKYYFSLYAADEEGHLSLPATIKVKVQGFKALIYSADDSGAYFLNDAKLTSDGITTTSALNGTFAAANEHVSYERLNSGKWSFNLTEQKSGLAHPRRLVMSNWQIFAGTVVTNFPWGEGPLGDVQVEATRNGMSQKTVTDKDGSFAILLPEDVGPVTLTFARQGCQFQPVTTGQTSTLKVIPEQAEGNGNSYLYLTVVDEDSNFYLENVAVSLLDTVGHTNSKGVSSNLSAPKGVNTVTVSLDGYDTVVTNFSFAGSSSMKKVALKKSQGRRGESLDLTFRDTDAKIIEADSFRLVAAATSSVLVNYPDGVPPFLSLPVMSGQKVIVRTQKQGYDNFNETFVLGDYTSKDIVLTPEPAFAVLALLLLAFQARKHR